MLPNLEDTSHAFPVMVVGAGPVGLLCALVLARAGVPVCVLESEPRTTLDLRAGTFHPPTLEMLEPLGVTQAMMAVGIRVPTWQSRDLQEGLVAEWDMGVLKNDTPYPYRLHLEQHRLTPILLGMLQAHPHAQVLFSHEFQSLDQTSSPGVVKVVAFDRSRSDQEPARAVEFTASWVIGADGGKSLVRKSVNIEFDGYTWPERYSVVSTTFDWAPLGYADNAYISDPDQWVAFFKMPDVGPPGLWRMTVPVGTDLSDEEVLHPRYANAIFNRVLNAKTPIEFPIVHQSVYRVHQRVAKEFRVGRVLLAGDSAHVNNPLGGFGLNSGIHDAMNLGEKLARVFHGESDEDLLDLYVRQRRTVNMEYVQEISIKNKHNLEEKDPVRRRERIALLRSIAQSPEKTREYLLTSSMINSIKRANAIT
jgi:3-(3-hydroxy-phenyl)propionate hydroxylase